MVSALLSSPYPALTSSASRWKLCLSFSVFVFLFLFVFQPFGLNTYPGNVGLLCAGYGLSCFVVMVLLNIGVIGLFPKSFAEESWNTGKQIVWIILNVLLVGLANLLFSNLAGIAEFRVEHLLLFEFFALAVAFFPVVISILWTRARLEKHYRESSLNLRTNVHANTRENQVLVIPSENEKENLRLEAAALLMVKSADNYSEVYYLEGGILKKKLMRNSLKNISASLEDYPFFFRCHKSYLVNLRAVDKVSGNAQGYLLHFPLLSIPVPVSRKHNEKVKKEFART